MSKFSDSERVGLIEARAISTDPNGSEILIGLNEEETNFVMSHRRKSILNRDHNKENKKRHIQLSEKHEIARLAVIGNELYLKSENPTRH